MKRIDRFISDQTNSKIGTLKGPDSIIVSHGGEVFGTPSGLINLVGGSIIVVDGDNGEPVYDEDTMQLVIED